MKQMVNKVMMYAKTAVTLAKLPFYFFQYKLAEVRYRQHTLAASRPVQDMMPNVDTSLALAR